VFHASAYAFAVVAGLDFLEHLRLEKQLTGRYWAAKAISIGESVNHALTVLVLLALLALTRPIPRALEVRDWFVLVAPGLFLALGWRDELVYHRRRTTHREDILHTCSHLAAAAMLTANAIAHMTRWR
jgi:hypothetical protein